MQTFELLGTDEDDLRLLHAPACGYSIVLAGHPRLAPHPAGLARHNVVIALGDVPLHHGFRIDEVPTIAAQELAVLTVTAYRNQRATRQAAVKTLPIAPAWMKGGARAIYPLRDQPGVNEELWVMIRESPTGLWPLLHATWFEPAVFGLLPWAHLRASFIGQHAWDGKTRETAPQLWPASTFTRAGAKLDLTDEAWQRAKAKRAEIGELLLHQKLHFTATLHEAALPDVSPWAPVAQTLVDSLRARLTRLHPQATEVLFRDVADCKTAHDLRGWAMQCTWAVGGPI